MSSSDALYDTSLTGLGTPVKGKVRDIYTIDRETMLIVTTDRISAFDVILPDPIPGKGRVLTSVSNFWFGRTGHLIPNHLTTVPLDHVISDVGERALLEGRAIVVRKLKPLPVEAIVRGYLIGSGWNDYQMTGSVCGLRMEAGMKQAQKLPEAIYTPSTKAEIGEHDVNIPYEKTEALLGVEMARQVRAVSLRLYTEAAGYALDRGIIIADTKFEFGIDDQGTLHLIDEVLTPDSSRFWPLDRYQPGISPPSFDKQFIRDYLETLDWDKTPPGPKLPIEIIQRSAQKYREAEQRLTQPPG